MAPIRVEEPELSPGPLIVGSGPVGMLTALRLAQLGVPSTLCEMSTQTTRWPKMDNSSPHTMEIFRLMGLVEEYRQQPGAVPQDAEWDTVFFNTCGQDGKVVSTWHMSSNDQYRAKIKSENDGHHPAEPGQRCSQIVLESLLKQKCLANPLIVCHYGYKFATLEEDDEGVTAEFTDPNNEKKHIRAAYCVGADGGQSRVRKSVGINLEGKPLPSAFFMVHFRSKALRKLSPFGNWWHAFGVHGGFVIDQDHNDTYTCHMPCAADAEGIKDLQEHPEQVPYQVLGGLGEPYKFEIDEVLVANAWRPNFALADTYVSRDGVGRVLLGGDSAHRNPPHGGYGMNSGVEDALSMAWRLSALHKGFGGPKLLSSYTNERRPNMMMRLERCDAHIGKFTPMIVTTMRAPRRDVFLEDSPDGEEARSVIARQLDSVGPENIDRGVELDLRYLNSETIVTDGTPEPAFDISNYTPSTRPGHRAPHLFLKNSNKSIIDLYGPEYTLMDFSRVKSSHQPANGTETNGTKTNGTETNGSAHTETNGTQTNGTHTNGTTHTDSSAAAVSAFKTVSKTMNIPLTHTTIDPEETHAKNIWQNYDLILIRPDGYVAWRGAKPDCPDPAHSLTQDRVHQILEIVTGWTIDPGFVQAEKKELSIAKNLMSVSGVKEELGAGEGQGDAFEGFFKDSKKNKI